MTLSDILFSLVLALVVEEPTILSRTTLEVLMVIRWKHTIELTH